MKIRMETIDILTSAGGAYTSSGVPVNGVLMRISYKPDDTVPLDTGADITLTETKTGLAIYTQANIGTAAFTKLPRKPISSAIDGSDAASVYDYIPTADKITLNVTNGGNAKAGKIFIVWGEL